MLNFPKDYSLINRAEKFDKEGNEIFEKLSKKYRKGYFK